MDMASNARNVIIRTSSFVNSNGLRIFCRYWEPPDIPRALVFISHGAVEHNNVYDPLARILASQNYYVFAHDHMGHGQSEGRRLQVNKFEDYVDDVFYHVDMVKDKFANLPIFLIAHSMGGAMGILANLRKPGYFKGTVLSGPAIFLHPKYATSFKVRMLKILARIAPGFPVSYTDYKLATRSEEAIKHMEKDTLIYSGLIKAGSVYNLYNAMEEIKAKFAFTDFPFLLLQGEHDKLCHVKGAEMMYEMSPSTDKTLKIYPKAYHNLLHEPDGIAEESLKEIVNWLEERTPSSLQQKL